MRKGFLAVVSVGTGCIGMLVFGVSILCQLLPSRGWLQSVQDRKLHAFPMAVEGTQLSALQLMRYEGPFWEDGISDDTAQVAALLVENSGGEYVSRGAVVLQWEAQTLVFEVYVLPPGAKVLVLEKDRQDLPEAYPDGCYGWSCGEYPEDPKWVRVEEVAGGTMAVENRSSDRIPLVQICYKTCNRESGIFLGGIAYTVEVRNLRPGERRLVSPFHYVCGNSEVVRIHTVYEE